MRVIIAGSRGLADYDLVLRAIEGFKQPITEIFSGHANGIDRLGERYAYAHRIPIKSFPYPKGHGKRGGPMRNKQMALQAQALIAIWDGQSKGTLDMITQAKRHGLIVHVHRTDHEARQGEMDLK